MGKIKVTVAIPVYNVQQYIGRCLDSVLSQSLSDIEVIIVDDCSPDQSMRIVEQYKKVDDRIIIITHKHNKGLMCARKTGYENAKGDYVFFLDSDDTIPQGALECLYKEALKNNADFVAGRLTYIKPNSIDDKSFPCDLRYGNDRISVIKSTLLWEITHTLCGKLFKKSLFEKGALETLEHYTNGEDGLLYYQLIKNISKVTCVKSSVYNYYQNSESSTQVKYTKKTLESIIYFYSYRYKVLKEESKIKNILDFATVRDLSILCGMGYSKTTINKLLSNKGIPYKLNLTSIVRYCDIGNAIKCMVRVYLLSNLRK